VLRTSVARVLVSLAGSAALSASAWSAESSRPTPHIVPCDVVFNGRIVDAWKPQKGIVALTVVVDVVEQASPPVCAPAGTFVVKLPSTHPLANEPAAVRKSERRFRAVGHTGVTTETTDLVVLGNAH
jgi:hypothetical protein